MADDRSSNDESRKRTPAIVCGGGQTSTLTLILLLLSCNPSGDNTDTGELVCTEDDLFTTEQCPDTYPDLECTVYVDGDVESSGDGWSWDSPVKTVQEGVDLAHCGAVIAGICTEWEVWVKEGTYYIHKGCREHTVRLREQVSLLGGFDGAETESYQRDWEANVTTLNGRDAPDSEDRVYHVVRGSDNAKIDGFTVTGGNADDENENPFNDRGGGMFGHYASPDVLNCIFEDNYAVYGGGIYFEESSGSETATINGCTFTQNTARNDCGAICIIRNTVSIVDCEILENTAQLGGAGGLGVIEGDGYVERCEIHSNSAWSTAGGILLWDSSLELLESSLHNNTLPNEPVSLGGGIYLWNSTISIEECDFVGNAASNGGAFFAGMNSLLEINTSFFADNTASAWGGAIEMVDSTAQLTDLQIVNNTARLGGGGVYSFYNTTTADRILLENNTAEWGGGFYNQASDTTISNAVFSANSAVFAGTDYESDEEGFGGGFHSSGSTSTLVNCTFESNTATLGGDAVYATAWDDTDYGYYEDVTTIVNSILWNNGAEEIGVGDSTLAVSYSDVTGGYVGDGNIDLDPLFVNATSGDFHLQAGSPCIGAANPEVAPELDMDGNPRDGEPDIGAYEF